MKYCYKCDTTKSLDEFNNNKRKKDGKATECRSCCREYQRQYSQTDAGKAAHRKANSKYERSAKGKARRDTPERRAYSAQAIANWKKTPAGRASNVASSAKRRAMKMEAKTFPSVEDYVKSVIGKPCMYCGDVGTTHEHIIPLVRGGDHSEGNIGPCCGSCNSSKGGKLLVEWRYR